MRFNWTDNVVMRAIGKIGDLICLNVLWLICCIPVITIGASTTALYTVMLRLVRNEEGYIFRGFFKAFKLNFKQSTIIWIILLLGRHDTRDSRYRSERDLHGSRFYAARCDGLHIPADRKV